MINSEFSFEFRKKKVTDEILTIEESADAAIEALCYIDSIMFFVGIPDTQDLQGVDSESLHTHLQSVSKLVTELNLIVWTQVERLERERKSLLNDVEFINS